MSYESRQKARDYVYAQRVKLAQARCGKMILGRPCVLPPGHDHDCHEGPHKRGHGPDCPGCHPADTREILPDMWPT